jgi:hypothetical protein
MAKKADHPSDLFEVCKVFRNENYMYLYFPYKNDLTIRICYMDVESIDACFIDTRYKQIQVPVEFIKMVADFHQTYPPYSFSEIQEWELEEEYSLDDDDLPRLRFKSLDKRDERFNIIWRTKEKIIDECKKILKELG